MVTTGIRTGGVVLALALLVGGCGGDDKKGDNAAPTTTTAAASGTSDATVTTGAPHPGTGSGGGGGDGTCGVHTRDGVSLRTFCGKASATLTMAGSDVTFTGGECETAAEYLAVNIGTIVLATGDKAAPLKATTAYFGMNVGRPPGDTSKPPADKDGTYTTAIGGNDHGRAISVFSARVVLSGGRTMGTISGTANEQPVTGRFACS